MLTRAKITVEHMLTRLKITLGIVSRLTVGARVNDRDFRSYRLEIMEKRLLGLVGLIRAVVVLLRVKKRKKEDNFLMLGKRRREVGLLMSIFLDEKKGRGARPSRPLMERKGLR